MPATRRCFLRLNMKIPLSERIVFMNFVPVYLICFLIFIMWLFYEQHKNQKQEKKLSDDFWAREAEANRTRKKDISHLPLLHVQESEIPVADTENESVLYYIDHIRDLIKSPMADLSEFSNTDLKLAYGVGNFKLLSEYDENFNNFLLALTNLARSYTENGFLSEAQDTYRLAFYYGSQKVSDYTGLANVYLQMEQPERVNELIQEVEASEHPHKVSIVQALQEVLMRYQ